MQPNGSNSNSSNRELHPLPDHLQQDDFLDHMLSSPWAPSLDLDEPLLLASRLRHHQISSPSPKPMVLQLNQQHQQLMAPSLAKSGEPALVPLPLSLSSPNDSNANPGSDGMFGGFGANQQQFAHVQNYGAPAAGMGQGAAASAGSGSASAAAGGAGPPRQRVRARRGQATDPHSIAERLRRERIAERMKALQELVPNANKTDKASMLDEIIDYVKFLQLQVKVLSMSRLGGAAAVAPLVADMSSEGGSGGPRAAPQPAGGGGNDSLTVTEHQVAKLMEEDMGSAMQYLQGKGLCLMPISLASAISTATGHPRNPPPPLAPTLHHHHVNAAKQQLLHAGSNNNVDGSLSPNLSVLTVQSTMAAADADVPRKDGSTHEKQ